MKALRIALELKAISIITVAIAGYIWTHSAITALGILITETLISLLIQVLWLKKIHKI